MEEKRIDGNQAWFSFQRWHVGDGTRIHIGDDTTDLYFVSDLEHNAEWIAAFTVADSMMISIHNGRARVNFTGSPDFVFVTGWDDLIPNSSRKFTFSRDECARIIDAIESD